MLPTNKALDNFMEKNSPKIHVQVSWTHLYILYVQRTHVLMRHMSLSSTQTTKACYYGVGTSTIPIKLKLIALKISD